MKTPEQWNPLTTDEMLALRIAMLNDCFTHLVEFTEKQIQREAQQIQARIDHENT